jgi:hypothetical protein
MSNVIEGEKSPSLPFDLDALLAVSSNTDFRTLNLRPLQKPNIVAAVETSVRRARIEKRILEGGRFLELGDPLQDRIALCTYGPSLNDFIPQIKAHKESGGKVCTVSGAHRLLKSHGIIADYHVEMDPRAHKADFVSDPSPETEYYIATSAHEDMYARLETANVVKWNVYTDDGDEKFLSQFPGNHFCLEVGSVVGLGALVVMCVRGYRSFDIYGMDCSLLDGVRHAGPHNGKRQFVQSVFCKDKWFRSTPQLIGALNDFFRIVPRLGQVNIELHGDGLLQYRMQNIMEKRNG